MPLEYEQARTTLPLDLSDAGTRPLRGRWLIAGRTIWLAIAIVSLGLFVASIPTYFASLQTTCTNATCVNPAQLTPQNVRALQLLGLSRGFYTVYTTANLVTWAAVWFVVAAVIFWRRSDDRMALLVAFFLVTFVIAFNGNMLDTLPRVWIVPIQFIRYCGAVSFGLFFSLFPDGRFVPRWTRWLILGWMVWELFNVFPPGSPFNVKTFSMLWNAGFIGFLVGLVGSQIYRYRYVSGPVQRQQTKWIVFGMSAALAGFIVFILLGIISSPAIPANPLTDLLANTLLYYFMLLIPLSIGFAVLRYRLWDIDIIINRTLVYVMLTACVIGIYVLVVGALSLLLQASGNLFISLLVTSLVAILFQPMRERLQGLVNRLMYGERDTPYRVLARLGQRWKGPWHPMQCCPVLLRRLLRRSSCPMWLSP